MRLIRPSFGVRTAVGAAILSAAINMLGLAGPLFMIETYDRVIPSGSLPTLVALVILVVGLYAFSGLLDVIRGRIFSRGAGLIDARLSHQVLTVVAGASLKIRVTGDILRPAQEMDQIRSFLGGSGPAALFDIPWIPIYLAICFFLHPFIGWLALLAMVILVGLTIATDVLTRSGTNDASAAAAVRNRFGEAVHRNAESVAAMGMLEQVQVHWQDAHHRVTTLQRRTGDVSSMFAGTARALRQAVQSGALAVGAYLFIEGEMSAGMIIAASIIVAKALQPVEQIISQWRNMLTARQAWLRLHELFKMFPEEERRLSLPTPVESLSVEAVIAGPPGERRTTVQNVSFRVPAGTVVGIIGPSASGKSSLLRAITGVWGVLRGRICLDRASLDQWSAIERGKHIGYMPQSSELFPGTIAENIARLTPELEDRLVIAAARSAGVHDMIVALPDGYETQVGDGGLNLSTGQRQRVALARALYGDPFLVALDEPNSNLDVEGDKALAQAIIDVKKRGGIVLVVAHRNSVLSLMDLLLVMENGSAKAFGPRDEVLKAIRQQRKEPSTSSAALTLKVVENEVQS